MGLVPDLGGHKELLTLDDGGNNFLQSGTDFMLILVDHGQIEVPVAIPHGNFDLRAKGCLSEEMSDKGNPLSMRATDASIRRAEVNKKHSQRSRLHEALKARCLEYIII